MDELLQQLMLAEVPLVAITGSPCRTRYVDIDLMVDVVGLMELYRPCLTVVHGGKPPFDLLLHESCDALGIPAFYTGPQGPWQERFGPRDSSFVAEPGVALLLVFSPEDGYPWDADVDAVELAASLSVPIWSISRARSLTYY